MIDIGAALAAFVAFAALIAIPYVFRLARTPMRPAGDDEAHEFQRDQDVALRDLFGEARDA